MNADEIRVRIMAGLPHAKAVAMRAGAGHIAWDVVSDAEAYMRGAPTYVTPGEIAEALSAYLPMRGDERR